MTVPRGMSRMVHPGTAGTARGRKTIRSVSDARPDRPADPWSWSTVLLGLILVTAALAGPAMPAEPATPAGPERGNLDTLTAAPDTPPPVRQSPVHGLAGSRSVAAARGLAPARARAVALSIAVARRRAEAGVTAPHRATARQVPIPVAVRIPRIDVDGRLVALGLNPDRTLEVPEDYAAAGWYVHGPVPGEPGPSVIAGHVDSPTGPAVFYELDELRPGATVAVERADRSVATFTVTAVERHAKDDFPTDRVYGPTTSPQLRLITCGGAFDRSSGHYQDNVIAFADLRRITRPGDDPLRSTPPRNR